ncbi:MAG: hypothetical protein BWX59_00881 [Bacteroidetes bacterium ADurb.Bin028]|nr:MAG: hypothetical protein BWX59_00881 [Bacteroidetes bacterium ADurb.Bin028]
MIFFYKKIFNKISGNYARIIKIILFLLIDVLFY